MPIESTRITLPRGACCLRLTARGPVNAAEARTLMDQLCGDGPLAGVPIVAISEPGVTLTGEARRVFASGTNDQREMWCAFVTQSLAMRVTLDFIGRLNGFQKLRLFRSEQDALAWLESVIEVERSTPG